MRIGHLELVCRDVGATRAFYERLGFELEVEQAGGALVWLRGPGGGPEMLLRPGEPRPGADGYARASLGIVLYTEAPDAAIAGLRAAGVAPSGEDAGCPLFRDPDGRWLQIVNPAEHGG